MDDIWPVFQRAIENAPPGYFIVDALDECNNSVAEVAAFINKFTKFVMAAEGDYKVVVTSRPELEPPGTENGCASPWLLHRIETSDVQADIELFTSTMLDKSSVLRAYPPGVKDCLKKAIINGSEGMILWASLMISEIEQKCWDVEAVLEKSPSGLSDLYHSILRRFIINPQFADRHMQVLRLVLAAAQPLRPDQVGFAVSIIEGLSDKYGDAHELFHRLYGMSNIVREVSPLVTLMPDGTAQLVHASLKDFLVGPELRGIAEREPNLSLFVFHPLQLHEPIASALVSYLSFDCFREEIGGSLKEVDEKYPLLEYASRYFIWHLTNTSDVSEETIDILAAFFASVQGWRWLQRLSDRYGHSCGHQLVLQSQLKMWMSEIPNATANRCREYGLDTFFVHLSRKRVEAMTQFDTYDQRTYEALANLASACNLQGLTEEAAGLQERLLELMEDNLGGEDTGTLKAMEDLATTYGELGSWEKAEALTLRVLDIRTRLLGDGHQETLYTMGFLACAYFELGRWKEAEEVICKAAAVHSVDRRSANPDNLRLMGILAWVHCREQRWDEAKRLDREVLDVRKSMLGENHPETLKAMGNLAGTYGEMGCWEEAEKLHRDVLMRRKAVLGVDHPDTLKTMAILAETYGELERWREAEELQTVLIERRTKVLGEDHPDTLKALGNLGWVYGTLKLWKETEDVDLIVLAGRERKLGKNHPDTLFTMSNLAREYGEMGRWEEAEEMQMKVLKGRKEVLGEDHLDTLKTLSVLGWIYGSQGRLEEAERLRLEVLDASRKVLGNRHPDVLALEKQPSWKSAMSTEDRNIGVAFAGWLQERTIIRAL
ncbi:TPR-like protein [Wilcoxina mikolae CBS 423.85]|nr:TPR-like protein [Wilcoxina mikolae CBS 423.85]